VPDVTAGSPAALPVLHTTAGDIPLQEYRVTLGARDWAILHTGLVLSWEDEQRYLAEDGARLPYGVALWPSSIALAHELMTRADALRGRHVLELGAGTGLAGIVAASLGAHVVQTDRHAAALHLCRVNGERNGATSAEQRLADWSDWRDTTRYDMIIGSDILYAEPMHSHLRSIFESQLLPGGRILLADPLRSQSVRLLEQLDANGWSITFSKWNVGAEASERSIAVYAISRD
jgi:predicted nicotinamide N-methyase